MKHLHLPMMAARAGNSKPRDSIHFIRFFWSSVVVGDRADDTTDDLEEDTHVPDDGLYRPQTC